MKYKDYYAVLGVARGADTDEIKRAYRRQARKYHPDVSTEPRAEERFKDIGEAYEVLKDPARRAAYDQLGSNWRAGQDFRPPPGWGRGFGTGRRSGSFQHGFGGGRDGLFSDFFESLFGDSPPRGSARTRTRGANGAAGPVRVTLSLEEAFRGTERRVRVPGGRTVKVKVPAGIVAGQRIRLAGPGRGGGGGEGDVFLQVDLAPHELFRVEGKDVSLALPVAPWEAALGATISTPTLGGQVDLRVPPGSQSGRRLRLRGRGLGGHEPGDQYVELKIVTPPADSDAARAWYRRMAKEFSFDPRAGLAPKARS